MIDFVHKMLTDASKEGYRIVVDGYEETPDYAGYNADLANEAINNVEEVRVIFYTDSNFVVGTAFIVNGLEEDERIADCDANGWVSKWTAANIV